MLSPKLMIPGIAIVLMAGGCENRVPATVESEPTLSVKSATVRSDGQAQTGGGLADLLKAAQSGQADKAAKVPLPDWKPFPSRAAAPTIPLRKGLVIVAAVSDYRGDYETIVSIVDVSSTAVRLAYSGELPPTKLSIPFGVQEGSESSSGAQPQTVSGVRVIDVADLEKAHGYANYFADKAVEHFPGTTAISASSKMLNQLRAGSEVEFHFRADVYSSFLQLGAQISGEKTDIPTITQYASLPMYACNLHRVEPTDLAVPVVVNDQRVELPAVHAM
jgi:hypothetical protein